MMTKKKVLFLISLLAGVGLLATPSHSRPVGLGDTETSEDQKSDGDDIQVTSTDEEAEILEPEEDMTSTIDHAEYDGEVMEDEIPNLLEGTNADFDEEFNADDWGAEAADPAGAANDEIALELAIVVSFVPMFEEDRLIQPFDVSPFLDVEYNFNVKQDMDLKNNHDRQQAEGEFEVNTDGLLAQGEFFACELEVMEPTRTMNISSALGTSAEATLQEGDEEPRRPRRRPARGEEANNEEAQEELTKKLVLRLQFAEKPFDVFRSLCKSTEGHELNTEGDHENYFSLAFTKLEPDPTKITIDPFTYGESYDIPLTVQETVIDDTEIAQYVIFRGEGVLHVRHNAE